jgi:hypothetical protein
MSDHAVASESSEETALFQKLRSGMTEVHQQVGSSVRSQHPKAHGVVRATFQVHDVPEAYRVGVFASSSCYAAWIRLSSGKEKDDRKPDIHGMAIKLLEVPGEKVLPDEAAATTQDFVLADHPVFFARDATHFLQFLGLKRDLGIARHKAEQGGGTAAELAELDNAQRIQVFKAFPVIGGFFKTVTSPLTPDYFSQTPYQFGDRVVKYFVKPAEANRLKDALPESEHSLSDSMQQVLTREQRPARFEFGIEVRTDPSMPIDDTTEAWNSPETVILATITIPPQDFLSDNHRAFGEALSFSPWHSLPEHQPLGSINRARRDTYPDSSATRHQAKGVARNEPDASYLNSLTLNRYFECFTTGDYRGMQWCLHPEVEFSDIGFDLRRKEVGAMWHMIVANAIQVSFRDVKVDGQKGTAHWECDYQFRKDKASEPRPVHNTIDSRFRFEGGLIREHRDECDFWKWFEQAMGPIGKGAHAFDFLEDRLEQLLKRELPLDVEQRVRAKVKETARQKIDAFIALHPEYAG